MAIQFPTASLTGSKVTYYKVGFVNGMLLRPGADGGVESTPAPKVAEALAKLHIPTSGQVVLQYKMDGSQAHFQWAGPKRNRDYGAAFDVPNPWANAKPFVAVSPEYLSEDEMA